MNKSQLKKAAAQMRALWKELSSPYHEIKLDGRWYKAHELELFISGVFCGVPVAEYRKKPKAKGRGK